MKRIGALVLRMGGDMEHGRLLVWRPDTNCEWGIPTGDIQTGEDPASAVQRIVEECAGLLVKPTCMVGPPLAQMDDPPVQAYVCAFKGGRMKFGDRCRFVSEQEVRKQVAIHNRSEWDGERMHAKSDALPLRIHPMAATHVWYGLSLLRPPATMSPDAPLDDFGEWTHIDVSRNGQFLSMCIDADCSIHWSILQWQKVACTEV